MSERVECDPRAAREGERTCGHTDMQGFDVVLECVRPVHNDDLHRTDIGQRWHCDEPADRTDPTATAAGGEGVDRG